MKRWAVVAAAALLGASGAVSEVVAQQAPASQIVRGDLLSINGDTYVVRDLFGRLVYLRVDKTTTMNRMVVPGERIEAQALPNGRAVSIRPVS